MNEDLIKEDIQFLLSLCSGFTKPEPGLDPTFYLTLVYEEDLKIHNRLQKIRERYL
jgi:hypothetical protein